MNLEELKIKVSLDLKDLNKQLSGISDSINKTFTSSVKKMAKTADKEVNVMAKDINKTLNKAFTLDSRKFDADVTRTMDKAKRTVRSACKEIRAELNKAFNIDGHIRVTASSKSKMTNSGSSNTNSAIAASSQYTGAMIIKATNAIISNNNSNTQQTISAINRATDSIIKAINAASKKKTSEKISSEDKTPKTIVIKQSQPVTSTRGQLVGNPYGPDLKAATEALKNAVKVANIINRNLSRVTNVKQLGMGSYGSNKLQGGTVNWIPGKKESTIPASFKVIDDDLKEQVEKTIDRIKRLSLDIPISTTLPRLNAPDNSNPQLPQLSSLQLPTVYEDLSIEAIEKLPFSLEKARKIMMAIIKVTGELAKDLKESASSAEKLGRPQRPDSIKNLNIEPIPQGFFEILDESQTEALREANRLIEDCYNSIRNINSAPLMLMPPDATAQLENLQTKISKITGEFESILGEVQLFDIDPTEFTELFGDVREYGELLIGLHEQLTELDKERTTIDIDTSKAEDRIKKLQDTIEHIVQSISRASNEGGRIAEWWPGLDTEEEPSPPKRRGNKPQRPPRPQERSQRPNNTTTIGFGFGAYKNEIEKIMNALKQISFKDIFNPNVGPAKLEKALQSLSKTTRKVADTIVNSIGKAFSTVSKIAKSSLGVVESTLTAVGSGYLKIIEVYRTGLTIMFKLLTHGFKEGGISGAVNTAGKALSSGLKNMIQEVKGLLQRVLGPIYDVLSNLFSKIGKGIKAVYNIISHIIDNIKNVIVNVVDRTLSIIEKAIDKTIVIVKQIGKTIADIAKAINNKLAEAFSYVLDVVGKTVDKCIDLFKRLWNTIVDVAKKIGDVITTVANKAIDVVSNAIDKVIEVAKKVGKTIIDVANKIHNTLANVIDKALDAIGAKIDKVIEVAKKFGKVINDVAHKVHNALVNAIDKALDVIGIKIDKVIEIAKKLGKTINDVAHRIHNALANVIDKAIDAIGIKIDKVVEIAKKLGRAVSDVASKINNALANVVGKSIDFVESKLDKLVGVVSNAFTRIKTEVMIGFAHAIDVVVDKFNGLANAVSKAYGYIVNLSRGYDIVIRKYFNKVISYADGLVNKVVQPIKTVISSVATAVKNQYIQLTAAIEYSINNIIDSVTNSVKNQYTQLVAATNYVFNQIVTAVKNQYVQVVAATKYTFNQITTAIKNQYTQIVAATNYTFNQIATAIKNQYIQVSAAIKYSISKIVNPIKNVTTKVKDTVKGLMTDASELAKGCFNKVSSYSSSVAKGISEAFVLSANSIGKLSKEIKGKVLGIFKQKIEGFIDVNKIQQNLNKIKNSAKKTAKSIKDSFDSATGSIGQRLGKAGSTFTGINTGNISKGLNKTKGEISKFASIARAKLNSAFAGIKTNKLYENTSKAFSKVKGIIKKLNLGDLGKQLDAHVVTHKIGIIKDTLEKLKKSFKGVSDALKSFANKTKSIWSKITGIFRKGAKESTSAVNGMTLGLKDLVKTGLSMFSLYKLLDLGKQAITASTDQAASELRLVAAMKQRMNATDDTIQSVRNLISAQSRIGVLGKDVVTMGAQQLAYYTQSAEALEALIPRMNNLLVRQEGFNASIDQAQEMAVRLGEALSENSLEPLRSADIPITDAEVETFKKLRTEEEKVAYLTALIDERVGNLNESLAQTPYGAIQQLKNNFSALLGTLGMIIVNAIQPLVQWLNVVVVACNNALTALAKLFGFSFEGAGFADSLSGGLNTGGVDSTTDSFKDAADAADEATEANEKFKGSLAGFDEINTLSDNSDKSEDGAEGGLDVPPISGVDIGTLVPDDSGAVDIMSNKMKAFIDEVLEPFKNAWALLGEDLKAEWADLQESFKNFCDSLARFLKSVWENGGKEFVQHMAEIALAVAKAAMEIGGEILDSLARLWEHLDPKNNEHTQRFLNYLNDTAEKLRDFLLGLGDHFESLMANGGQDVLNALGDCIMDLGAAAVKGFGLVIQALDGLIDHLDPATNEFTRGMLKAWADAFHDIGQSALDFVDFLESVLNNGGQDVINSFGDMLMNLGELAGRAVSVMCNAFSGLLEHLDPVTNEITQGALKTWEEAFSSVGQAALSLADLLESTLENGGQEFINSLGDLAMQVVEFGGVLVKEGGDALNNFFKHLDPATNSVSKGALDSFKYFTDSITGFVDMLGESLSLFMDKGGQEFVNNVGDIILLVGDLAATIGGDIINTITAFFDSWAGQLVIETVARALELVSSILKGLLEILQPLTPIISAVVSAIGGFMVAQKVGGFITTLVTVFQSLGGAGGILTLVQGAFSGLWAILAANPIAATVAAIVGITTALVAAYNKCEWFREGVDAILEAFSGTFEALKETCSEFLENITDIFQNVIDIIVGIFTGDGERVGKALRELFGNLLELAWDLITGFVDIGVNLIDSIVKGLWEGIKLAFTAVKEIFLNLGEFIVDVFKGFFGINSPSKVFKGFGGDIVQGLIDGITGMFSKAVKAISDLGKNILEGAKTIVKDTVAKFKEVKDGVVEKLKETREKAAEKWSEIKEDAGNYCSKLVETAQNKYSKVKDKVSGILSETAKDMSKKWEDMKKDTANKCKSIYDDVTTKFSNTKKDAINALGNIKQEVSNKWNEVKESTSNIISTMKENASQSYDKLKENLGNTISKWNESSSKTWDTIKEKTCTTASKLKDEASETYETLKSNLSNTLEKTREVSANAWDKVKSTTSEMISKLTGETSSSYDDMKEKISNKLEDVKNKTGAKWTEINNDAKSKITDIVKDASNKFGDIKNGFTNKLTDTKSALVSKWNDLKSQAYDSAKGIAEQAKSGLSNIGQTIATSITNGKSKVSSALNEIGRLFKNANWELPKIKLPHIKVTGEWSFNPPRVPKFSIQWNKRGGIIDGITPIGFANGALQMGGEAGKEMVVPLENTSFTSKIAQAMGQAVDNAMRRSYSNNNNNNNGLSDNRDIILKVNEKELARTTISSINKLQRETGRTLLDV
jgi:phage-related protein